MTKRIWERYDPIGILIVMTIRSQSTINKNINRTFL